MEKYPTIIPAPLKRGDRIAIVSPASKIDHSLIDAAASQLEGEGFEVVIGEHAKGEYGSFSGTPEQRLADLRRALEDPRVKCILCSRGGYGAVHLLEELDTLPRECFGKWLVGFSDISALHALWARKGVGSLHAAMAKYIGMGEGFGCYADEMAILRGADPMRCWQPHPFNRPGSARGRVVGGNMAVLGGLMGTPFSPLAPGCILLIEDIAEPIYKVERLLWQLRLQGFLENLAGLVVGQFTDYRAPSADYSHMEEMIRRMTLPYSYPVAFNVPVGHIEENAPVLLNAEATLTVTPSEVRLDYR